MVTRQASGRVKLGRGREVYGEQDTRTVFLCIIRDCVSVDSEFSRHGACLAAFPSSCRGERGVRKGSARLTDTWHGGESPDRRAPACIGEPSSSRLAQHSPCQKFHQNTFLRSSPVGPSKRTLIFFNSQRVWPWLPRCIPDQTTLQGFTGRIMRGLYSYLDPRRGGEAGKASPRLRREVVGVFSPAPNCPHLREIRATWSYTRASSDGNNDCLLCSEGRRRCVSLTPLLDWFQSGSSD
ncbi:hypothetical protein O3P69_017483 [Scylla paramamosain]|uniref:Uncharacterized protein n=1 Tax=Scylla paramamosain TaxID=85552 RepID=A0AAW0TWH1_SCYPA